MTPEAAVLAIPASRMQLTQMSARSGFVGTVRVQVLGREAAATTCRVSLVSVELGFLVPDSTLSQ